MANTKYATGTPSRSNKGWKAALKATFKKKSHSSMVSIADDNNSSDPGRVPPMPAISTIPMLGANEHATVQKKKYIPREAGRVYDYHTVGRTNDVGIYASIHHPGHVKKLRQMPSMPSMHRRAVNNLHPMTSMPAIARFGPDNFTASASNFTTSEHGRAPRIPRTEFNLNTPVSDPGRANDMTRTGHNVTTPLSDPTNNYTTDAPEETPDVTEKDDVALNFKKLFENLESSDDDEELIVSFTQPLKSAISHFIFFIQAKLICGR